MDAAVSIPDGIAPISAYRAWRYELVAPGASLHALTCGGIRPCGWTPGRWVSARCDRGAEHMAPQRGCSCGFHGMKSLSDILAELPPPIPGIVVGRVEFAGCVIEHDLGYRAGRARIAELFAVEGWAADVMRIANLLGIPMAPLLPLAEMPLLR